MRRLVGRMIEWFLRYERVVEVFKDPDAQMPNQNYHGDGGYDIYVNESVEIPPKSILNISSGVYLAPRSPIWFEIKGRSSTFHKKGLEIVDAVIDNGYRGELFCVAFNPAPYPVVVNKGSRVCQIIPHISYPIQFRQVKELSGSKRGDRGFGSSGE